MADESVNLVASPVATSEQAPPSTAVPARTGRTILLEQGQKPMPLQNAIVLAIVTAFLGGSAGSGIQFFSDDGVKTELQELRHEISNLNEKIDDIFYIVDHAHPRDIGPKGD